MTASEIEWRLRKALDSAGLTGGVELLTGEVPVVAAVVSVAPGLTAAAVRTVRESIDTAFRGRPPVTVLIREHGSLSEVVPASRPPAVTLTELLPVELRRGAKHA